jgi:hypothetical protein
MEVNGEPQATNPSLPAHYQPFPGNKNGNFIHACCEHVH